MFQLVEICCIKDIMLGPMLVLSLTQDSVVIDKTSFSTENHSCLVNTCIC